MDNIQTSIFTKHQSYYSSFPNSYITNINNVVLKCNLRRENENKKRYFIFKGMKLVLDITSYFFISLKIRNKLFRRFVI